MEKKRSRAVTIISSLEMAIGLAGIIFSILLIVTAIPGLGQQNSVGGSEAQLAIGEVFLVISLIIFTVGIFTFLLKAFARILHLIFLVLIIVLSIYTFFVYALDDMIEPGPLCIAILAGVLLFFFTRPKVKEQFR